MLYLQMYMRNLTVPMRITEKQEEYPQGYSSFV